MTRLETIEAYRSIKSDADVRALLLGDLFFLLTYGLGRLDADCDFIFERCREVQAKPDDMIDLWAREHYKSTIITFALSIQEVLRNPNITIGIFSHTRPIAKAFLKQIKREFEGNHLLQQLFPHIEPPLRGERRTWSEDEGLVVDRTSNPKEATIEAWGLVDGQPVGKHFDILIYDDVVTPASVNTPEMIAKTTEAWQLSLNLGAHGGKRRIIGTRYHAADTYKTILDQGSAEPRIYAATDNGKDDGSPVFLTPEALAKKRQDMGPYVFACQMLQNPLADNAQGFNPAWFRGSRGEIDLQSANIYILVDPASSKKRYSDYTSMWVVALCRDQNYYVVDGVHDRLNLTERAETLFELHRTWGPTRVGYERYGMQADIEHIQYMQDQTGYRFQIFELAGTMNKNDRIRRLVPLFEQGRIYFPNELVKFDRQGKRYNLVQDFFEQEYSCFPVSGHDDMLDCLARIVEPELGAVFPRNTFNLRNHIVIRDSYGNVMQAY